MSLTIELSPEAEAALKRQAESHGMSLEDYALQRLSAASTQLEASPSATADEPEERPIWEEIAEIMSEVPDEEFAKLPRDGASQVDHYLYGHPKR